MKRSRKLTPMLDLHFEVNDDFLAELGERVHFGHGNDSAVSNWIN